MSNTGLFEGRPGGEPCAREAPAAAREVQLGVVADLEVGSVAVLVHSEQQHRVVARRPRHVVLAADAAGDARGSEGAERIGLALDGIGEALEHHEAADEDRAKLVDALGVLGATCARRDVPGAGRGRARSWEG